MKFEEENQQSWDPLDAADSSDQEIISAAKKREIKNILKSYVGAYDSFSELLQNAMDAIEKRAAVEKENFEPKIIVSINIKDNSVEIVDNGCGFEADQFRSFLAPSISFKSGGGTRGNKGVGVTYIAYGFNDLTIRTKNKDFRDTRRIRRGRDWVDDASGTVARPRAELAKENSEYFESIDQGTSFKIKFGGNNTRPKNLNWYQASTPAQWLYLLLLKTPLGYISIEDGSASPISFDLHVIDADGNQHSLVGIDAKYKYPHEEISASQRLGNVLAAQELAIKNGKDPSQAIQKFKNSNGIYERYASNDLIPLLRISDEEKQLIMDYKISAYGYFAYSTEVWDQLNDKKAGLRKNYRVLRGGLQLANNRMAQGDLITIPLTKSIGHQNQTHVIVHFHDAEPDLGRKGFQPELKELAEKISVMIVGKLSDRRDILKSDSGAQADIEKDIKVHEWLKDQESHEQSNPLELKNQNFFLPTKKISIGSTPRSEQDVIVLFNQLLAGGVIRGIRLLSTSQVAQYDGVFRYCAEEPLENQYFDKTSNPLGVLDEQIVKPFYSPPKILEYKYSLDGLIREFESGLKNAQEIELAVFWDMGKEYLKEFSIISYLDFDNVHQRRYHGISHSLSSGTSRIQLICLRELMELLNNPSKAQEYQSKTYGINI